MNGEPIPEPIADLLAVEVRQRFAPVNVEVVEYEVEGRRFRVVVRPWADYLGELSTRTARGGKSKRLARFRLDSAEDIGCAAPFLSVVIPCFAAWRRRRRGPPIGVQRDGLFVQTKYWFRRMVRLFLGRENILPFVEVVLLPFRHAPHFFPPRLEVVVQEQKADGFSPHLRDQWAFDGFLGDQPIRPAGTPGGRIAADHRDEAWPPAFRPQCLCSGPRLILEGSVQTEFLVAASDLPDRFRGQLHRGRDCGNGLAVRKWAKGQPSQDHAPWLNAAAQHGIQNLTVGFPQSHAKTPVDPHV
jgi:hypothetical protein